MLRALALNLPGHVTNKRALSPPCTVAQSTHVSHLTTSAQKHRNVPTCKYLPKGRGAPSVPQALPVPESDLIEVADEEKFNELRQMFKMADIDENGRIDRTELRQLLESVDNGRAYLLFGGWLPEDQVNATMVKYDKDKSGDIDFDEFTQLVYDGLLLQGALEQYEEAFAAVDDSGNGTLGRVYR
eukprot:jgi/Chrzof1/15188/Cz09g30240.t1